MVVARFPTSCRRPTFHGHPSWPAPRSTIISKCGGKVLNAVFSPPYADESMTKTWRALFGLYVFSGFRHVKKLGRRRVRKSRVRSSLPQLTAECDVIYADSLEKSIAACAQLNAALGLADEDNDDAHGAKNVIADDGSSQPCAEPPKLVIGVDCEWKPNFKPGSSRPRVATLQVATKSLVVVFHLTTIGCICKPLKALLCRSDVMKAGVHVQGDATKLKEDYMDTESCIGCLLDIGVLARHERGDDTSMDKFSLTALCEQYLGKSLAKPPKIRCGDWERVPLSQDQLNYATNDAWASLCVARELIRIAPGAVGKTLARIRPPSKCYWEAWDLFYKKGMPMNEIAEICGIKEDTAKNYIREIIKRVPDAYDLDKLLPLCDSMRQHAMAAVGGGAAGEAAERRCLVK